ncbi:MAG: hypothetical protein M3P47_05765, partial [Pseudomonadota bacterium]|nr:hypothetical protein [Pseudomonadota bacterium]
QGTARKGKTKRAELAFLHNHAYFVIRVLGIRGLFSVALILLKIKLIPVKQRMHLTPILPL